MTVDRSVSVIANTHCAVCKGKGSARKQPCGCITRRVFDSVFGHFRFIEQSGPFGSAHRVDARSHAINPPRQNAMKRHDFVADVQIVVRRTLTGPRQYTIWQLHFLRGLDQKACCQRLKMAEGPFWHEVYRIKSALGIAFMQTQPYALWPLGDYFGCHRSEGVQAFPATQLRRDSGPVRAPLAQKRAVASPVPVLEPVACLSPASEPVMPVVIDAQAFARARFRDDGASTKSIAADLSRRGVPAPNGAHRWGQSDVRRLLLAA